MFKNNCVKMETELRLNHNTPSSHSATDYKNGGQYRKNSNPSEVTALSCTDALTAALIANNNKINNININKNKNNNENKITTCHLFRCSTTTATLYVVLLLISLCSSVYSCGPGRGIGGSRRNRKLTPLVFKQHVPNMSEKTLGASGLNEGVIRRDSPNFKNLVPNYNKDIIFKDEEGTGADRLMSRRCKEKLNILAVSVMNQWPGVRLRVTESWDEDNLHGADSLHYEGRAVDITTSDRDRTKYGMLARLAVEAGFDWVYYESRAHIHCSVKSDSTQTLHMNGCFTRDSTVLTSAGERKSMADLLVGDRVLSMNEHGEPIYSEIILFMDRNLEQKQEFVQIITEGDAVLTVTPAHLVMIWRPEQKTTDYVFAAHVEEGDYVFVHDTSQKSSVLRPQRVVKLSAVLGKGVVAPLTKEGTIVVDTVAASCYAIVDSQTLAHWSMAPMRLLASMESWWSPARNEISVKALNHQHYMSKQNGVHWYAKTLNVFKDYIVPKSWQYQL